MSLITVLSTVVRPEKIRIYETLLQRIADEAKQKKDKLEWSTHQVTMGETGAFRVVSEAESWSELSERGNAQRLIQRLFGDKEAQRIVDQIRECVLQGRSVVCRARQDISLPANEEGGAAQESVTLFRARPGGQPAVEELIRKVGQALEMLGDERRFTAFQTVIGNLRDYTTVMPLTGLGQLDARQPAQILVDAFGAEGALIYRNGMEAIEHSEREMSAVRVELSHAPWVESLGEERRKAAARGGKRAATAGRSS